MTHSFFRACFTAVLGAALMLPTAHLQAAGAVVGTGTAASCTEDTLKAVVSTSDDVTFNCGAGDVTITLTSPLDITKTQLTIDGGGKVALSGGGKSKIIRHHTYGLIGSSVLTLKNMTIKDAAVHGTNEAANGGAIESFFEAAKPEFKPTLNIENVQFLNNMSTVDSFTSGDAYDFGGGAIYTRGGFVNITNSMFGQNQANNGAGGALHVLQSGVAINNSTFTNNTAIGAVPANSLGGAIYVDGLGGENGRLSIIGSRFEGNNAYNSGGAIHVNMYENTSATIIDQTSFTGNAVIGGTRAQGGAIGGGGSSIGGATGNPAVTITRSLFANNSAKKTLGAGDSADKGPSEDGSGGAVALSQRAVLTIENVTFSGNQAFGTKYNANGGALYVQNNITPFQVRSSTFANNSAGWVGGAITNSQINNQPGGVLTNTIFAGNTAANGGNDWKIQQTCSDTLTNGGGNMQTPVFTNDRVCAENITVNDPKLQPLAANGGATQTIALSADSPAVDSGNAAACPATDQRGIARPQGRGCDSGAFELVQKLSVSPGLVAKNTPTFTLTVRGAGFTTNSKIVIAGTERATTRVDSATLTTQLSGADLSEGVLDVSVSDSALSHAQLTVVASLKPLFIPLVKR